MLSLLLGLAAAPAQPLVIPNRYGSTPPGCVSIPRQVAGEDKTYPGTRLDRQPPGKLLHAVERKVAGCSVVTLVAGERRRAR